MSDNSHHSKGGSTTPQQAKQALIEGNQRFVTGAIAIKDLSSAKREDLFKNGQKPFAVVLTCSDSRVPPELLFDQGLGDIFVVRVAGNIVDALALGSIEYGVEHLGAPLLVVLGHSKCGAVKATVDGGEAPGSISAIINRIQPSVDKVRAAGVSGEEVYSQVEDENVLATIEEIKKSPIIKHMTEHGELQIAGAKYNIETGAVRFN